MRRRTLALILAAAAALVAAPIALAATPPATLGGALRGLFVSLEFQTAVVLIILDVGFGVAAALKTKTFRFSYLADFGRNDVAFKLLPWGALYVAAEYAGGQQLVIPGVDLGTAATAFYVAITAAWAASLVGSLKQLGVPGVKDLPSAFTKPEHPPAPK